jgi:hypothetical protein
MIERDLWHDFAALALLCTSKLSEDSAKKCLDSSRLALSARFAALKGEKCAPLRGELKVEGMARSSPSMNRRDLNQSTNRGEK